MSGRLSNLLSLLFFCAGAIFAQGSLSGPSLGVFFDPAAQAIRPIWGVPGAATAGAPLDAGFPVIAAAVSPAQDYSLGVLADGSVDVITLTGSGPTAQPLSGALAAPDEMALSPTGQSAALLYAGAATVQIFTGLPNAPQLAQQTTLSLLPNTPDVIAISDDGTLLVAGVRENSAGAPAQGEVFVLGPGNTARSIASVQHASALAFVAQSHDALFTDDLSNSVTLIQDAGGGANVSWTLTGQSISAPDSVRASQDRKNFLVGSSTSGTVAILDSSGSNAVVVACACAPSELRPLSAASVYQLTEPSGGLLWILDGQSASPRAVFVPIPSSSSEAGDTAGITSGPGRQ